MKKIGLIIGITAVTALTGCLDPKYKVKKHVVTQTPESTSEVGQTSAQNQNAPKTVTNPKEIEVVIEEQPAETKPAVETKPAPEPETTIYIVQSGDTLSKISKRYNIKMDAIKKLNPKMKGETVRLGEKLKLPGRVEVGEQTVPAAAKATSAKKPVAAPYTGATKDYVIQSGDTLGAIAIKFGCSVAQLKELNGLASDSIRAGKKLKVPAEKIVAKKTEKKAEAKKVEQKAEAAKPAEAKPAETAPAETSKPDDLDLVVEEISAPAAAEPSATSVETIDYDVKEGEDWTYVAIQFDTSAAEIRQLNNLPDDAQLTPGMKIKVPVPAGK